MAGSLQAQELDPNSVLASPRFRGRLDEVVLAIIGVKKRTSLTAALGREQTIA